MVDSESKAQQLGFFPLQSAMSVLGGAAGAGEGKRRNRCLLH